MGDQTSERETAYPNLLVFCIAAKQFLNIYWSTKQIGRARE